MIPVKKSFLAACMIGFLTASLSAQNVDEGISASELARALGVSWSAITLPGTAEDSYSIGTIIEFGDGTKSVKSGTIGLIKGGSVVKLFVKTEGDFLVCSTVSGSASSIHKLPNPFVGAKNQMTSGGSGPYSEEAYLIKASKKNTGIESHCPLKQDEVGIRLMAIKAD